MRAQFDLQAIDSLARDELTLVLVRIAARLAQLEPSQAPAAGATVPAPLVDAKSVAADLNLRVARVTRGEKFPVRDPGGTVESATWVPARVQSKEAATS